VFEVADLRQKQQLILSLPWLRCHNPTIDWSSSTTKFDKCLPNHHLMHTGVAELREEEIHTLDMQAQAIMPESQLEKGSLLRVGTRAE
jgi:hypothetical protein